MQFGRIHGIALGILGFILIGFQAMLYTTSNQVLSNPNQSSVSTIKVKTNPFAGILGMVLLVAGGAIVATARRADEPPQKNAVK
jgi:ABC-type transport system involved in multi-copper enzyme maturation permease subunit